MAAIGFPGLTDPRLERGAEVTWLQPGEVGAALAALKSAGVHEAVMAGKVPKMGLVGGTQPLEPDAEALRLLARLADRRDDSILNAVADFLEERGIRLLPQTDLVSELLAGEGVLGSIEPSDAQRADVDFGLPMAKVVAGLDVGQTVIVKDRAVLAVEAIEGTDAAIRRAGAIAPGGVVIKVAKPTQDPRFDVPAVGPDTLAAMLDAGATVLAVEADCTLILERPALVEAADAAGIALLGVAAGRAS